MLSIKKWFLIGLAAVLATAIFYSPITATTLRGDMTGDGTINIADVIMWIDYALKGGPAPDRIGEADVNCDARINMADGARLIGYLFRPGLMPCSWNYAYRFDGDDYIDLSGYVLNPPYTLEARFRTTASAPVGPGEYLALCGEYPGGSYNANMLDIMDAGYVWFHSGIGDYYTGDIVKATRELNDGGWHMVSAVRTIDSLFLYIDGVLDNSIYTSRQQSDSDDGFHIGRVGDPGFGNVKWIGDIDEVRVWNTSRTAAQIFDDAFVMFTGPQPGLVGAWGFDNAIDDTCEDITGNGNSSHTGSDPGPDNHDPVHVDAGDVSP